MGQYWVSKSDDGQTLHVRFWLVCYSRQIRTLCHACSICAALQSLNPVTFYLKSKQLLAFCFACQYIRRIILYETPRIYMVAAVYSHYPRCSAGMRSFFIICGGSLGCYINEYYIITSYHIRWMLIGCLKYRFSFLEDVRTKFSHWCSLLINWRKRRSKHYHCN